MKLSKNNKLIEVSPEVSLVGVRESQSLKVLKLGSCSNLKAVGDSIRGLTSLTELDVSLCPNGGGFGTVIGDLVNLQQLKLYGCTFVTEDDLLKTIAEKLVNLKKIWLGFVFPRTTGGYRVLEKFRELRTDVVLAS